MRAPSASDLIEVWEIGASRGSGERAQLLLERCQPELSPEQLRALPIGARDALLLRLREQLFGPRLDALLRCSHCGEPFEVHADLDQLRAEMPPGGVDAMQPTSGAPMNWRLDALTVHFRLPTGGDLIALEGYRDLASARNRLIERCLIDASRDGEPIAPAELTATELAELAEHIAAADPSAELLLNGDCPSCGARWESLLDIAAYLWTEIERRVGRLLTEVHTLARAYGWREQDILAMSERRRRTYLAMVLQ